MATGCHQRRILARRPPSRRARQGVSESDSDVIRERFKSDSHRIERFGDFGHVFRVGFRHHVKAIRMVEHSPYIILEGWKCPWASLTQLHTEVAGTESERVF